VKGGDVNDVRGRAVDGGEEQVDGGEGRCERRRERGAAVRGDEGEEMRER
jgi:hypothetical protein